MLKQFNVDVEKSEQNCALAWRLVFWIRGKEALMDVPDRDSPSFV